MVIISIEVLPIFFNLYIKYGERFAEWIDNKPWLQKVIRKWMDKRIENFEKIKTKTAEEIGPV